MECGAFVSRIKQGDECRVTCRLCRGLYYISSGFNECGVKYTMTQISDYRYDSLIAKEQSLSPFSERRGKESHP